jgi:hypothetical protein
MANDQRANQTAKPLKEANKNKTKQNKNLKKSPVQEQCL